MIEDPHFTLDLGEDWEHLSTDDPKQYNFRDAVRDVAVTLSAIPLDLTAETLDEFTSMFVELRLKAEGEAATAFHHRPTIFEPVVVPQPWGRAIAFYGYDDGGRRFGFSGSITPHFLISLYVSTDTLSQQKLMEEMDDIGTRIVFDRTPLDAPSRPH